MVKLYLNGKLLLTGKPSAGNKYIVNVPVPYEPGELRAAACDADGREYATTKLITAGEPYAIRLTPESNNIKAGASDLLYVALEIIDKEGNVCPNAAIPVDIAVSGSGSLLAAASANFKDLEPKTSNHVTTYKGRAILVVRSGMKKGMVRISAKSAGIGGHIKMKVK